MPCGFVSSALFREWGSEILTEMRTVKIPAALGERAEEKFGKVFGSLNQLVEYVLTDLLNDNAAQADQHERHLIEQRLKDLGYL
jgi:hypothetical protein